MKALLFLGVGLFAILPVCVVYLKVLSLAGRTRLMVRYALALAFTTGVVCTLAGVVILERELEGGIFADPDEIFEKTTAVVLLYVGLVSLLVGCIYWRFNPARQGGMLRCPACRNRKHLHTYYCVRCGFQLSS